MAELIEAESLYAIRITFPPTMNNKGSYHLFVYMDYSHIRDKITEYESKCSPVKIEIFGYHAFSSGGVACNVDRVTGLVEANNIKNGKIKYKYKKLYAMVGSSDQDVLTTLISDTGVGPDGILGVIEGMTLPEIFMKRFFDVK